MRRYHLAIDVTGSVEGFYAFIYWEKKVEIWSGVTDAFLTDGTTYLEVRLELS